jgi:hypothetical protein
MRRSDRDNAERGGGVAEALSAVLSLWDSALERCALFWLSLLDPRVNEPDKRSVSRTPPSAMHNLEAWNASDGEHSAGRGVVIPPAFRRDTHTAVAEEDVVSEASFLSQLEQRTQQVKITLANLEAEKTRIEELIGRLQPLVPHYDALLAAEQSIRDANISLETAAPPAPQAEAWSDQQEPQGTSWNG